MIPEINPGAIHVEDTFKPQVVAARMQAIFMEFMIKAMEESVEADGGLFGNSASSEIYRGMFREHLASAMSGQMRTPLEAELQRRLEGSQPSLEPAAPPEPEPLPVEGTITSSVGWRRDPMNGAMRFHRGTDIAAPLGTEVRAVEAGTVVESGPKGSYGNAVVILTESGRRTLYAHNLANLVRTGDRVRQGEAIARVGATGRATGPHVHFEVME
jgi:murein DD-endopeptidase MepM/ murein hydrolase activator NlpD